MRYTGRGGIKLKDAQNDEKKSVSLTKWRKYTVKKGLREVEEPVEVEKVEEGSIYKVAGKEDDKEKKSVSLTRF